MRSVATALALLLLIAPARASESVDDVYYAGTEAFRSGDLKTALRHFDAVRRRIDSEHPLFAPIHYNLGRCAELMVEREQAGAPVCEAVGWFETFLTHADEQRSEAALARARSGKALLSARCAASKVPAPAPAPRIIERVVAPPPSDPTRWWLAGGAAAAAVVGGVALFLAAEADADADAALDSYHAAETEAEGDRWAGLVREAESEAMTRSIIGLAGLAGAVGLGVAAVVWQDDPPVAAAEPRAVIGLGSVTLHWRF